MIEPHVWRRRILYILGVLLLAGVFWKLQTLVRARRARLKNAPRIANRPIAVSFVTAKRGRFARHLSLRVRVEARRRSALSLAASGVLVQLDCDEGDRVAAGKVLARLDDELAEKAVETGRRGLEKARADVAAAEAVLPNLTKVLAHWTREAKRDARLAKEGTVPNAQAETSALRQHEAELRLAEARGRVTSLEAAVKTRAAELDGLERRLADFRLTSPFAGVVTRVFVERGQQITAGRPIVEIEDRSELRLVASLPAEDADRVRLDQQLLVQGPSGPFESRIRHVDPALDAEQLLRVEATVPEKVASSLSTGRMLATRLYLDAIENTVLLPRRALAMAPGGKPHAFVQNGERLAARPLSLLGETPTTVAVTGLQGGERVVANAYLGWARLSENAPVEVLP